MGAVSILTYNVEECIGRCIEHKYEEHCLTTAFPNPLLREDVLELLDRFCTVLYYPLDGEENNGFHVTNMPLANGDRKHFVFINTAQTMEKQVFTAAHELGHIWKVDEYVINKLKLEDTPEERELIINRFAAVLLVPEKQFRASISEELKRLKVTTHRITVLTLLKLVVILMNQFFVPMKAIVLRLYELGYLNEGAAKDLLGQGEIPKEAVDSLVDDLIADYGYVKFQKASRKKWIDGLSELLDEAEMRNLVSPQKIAKMREAFELKTLSPIDSEWNNLVSLTDQEGSDV